MEDNTNNNMERPLYQQDLLICHTGSMMPLSLDPEKIDPTWGKRDMANIIGGAPGYIPCDYGKMLIYDIAGRDAAKPLNATATFLAQFNGFSDFIVFGNALYIDETHYDPKKR